MAAVSSLPPSLKNKVKVEVLPACADDVIWSQSPCRRCCYGVPEQDSAVFLSSIINLNQNDETNNTVNDQSHNQRRVRVQKSALVPGEKQLA